MKRAGARFRASVAGMSPESAALLLTIGLVLGVFPVYGCPTVLCALAALLLRLNLPAVQLVNQVTSPLQFALLLPFSRFGALVSGGSTLRGAWQVAGMARDAVLGWCCLSVPAGIVLYFVLVSTLRRCRLQPAPELETPA